MPAIQRSTCTKTNAVTIKAKITSQRKKAKQTPTEDFVRQTSNFSKPFLAARKAALRAELEDCLRQRRRALEGILSDNLDPQDTLDLAAHLEAINMETEKINNCAARIVKIETAVLAICRGRGEYGICAFCGQLIEEKRLVAEPWADTCVDCQEKIELTR